MRTDKKKQATQRKIMEQKIHRFSKLNEPPPPSGWVKAIRGSLGMTIRQLAERVGVGHGSIAQLEKREPQRKVTLASLDRAAQAMECRVVYALVPKESGASLDTIIESKAREMATRILRDVEHTMRLEAQGTSSRDLQSEIERIASELKAKADSRIWNVPKSKTKGGK
jgi:predicted DNA-binding mobile mystery protein A